MGWWYNPYHPGTSCVCNFYCSLCQEVLVTWDRELSCAKYDLQKASLCVIAKCLCRDMFMHWALVSGYLTQLFCLIIIHMQNYIYCDILNLLVVFVEFWRFCQISCLIRVFMFTQCGSTFWQPFGVIHAQTSLH